MKNVMIAIGAMLMAGSIQAADRPLKIAVFGDSVSAGVFSTEYLGRPTKRFYDDVIQTAARVASATIKKIDIDSDNPSSLPAWNWVSYPMRREFNSYTIGNRHYSLKTRIQNTFGVDVEFDTGVMLSSGYEAHEIAIEMVDSRVRDSGVKPDIVLAAYTAMDFLHGRTPEQMRSYVRAFFTKIVSLYPESDIVVTQLMDPVEGIAREDRMTIPYISIPGIKQGPVMCSEVIKIVGFGGKQNLKPGASAEVVEKARLTMNEFRVVFRQELSLIQEKKEHYSNFKGRFLFVTKDGIESEVGEHLSADCIHPTDIGQEILSNMLWDKIEGFIADNEMANYDFNTLPEICEENDGLGHGRVFWCGFGKCAKKSEDVVSEDSKESWCRVTKY